MALKLNVVVTSTRPGRVGRTVGEWFHAFALEDGRFDAELVDLADFNLPVYDEPVHPRLGRYQHEHTRRWAASAASADAFVFVTPEYNYGPTPALINALTYLYSEWNYKPAGFVAYGGVSGGLRGVQVAKQIMTSVRMMPIPEQVSIQMISQQIENGVLKASENHRNSAKGMLHELERWATALKPMRQPAE